MDDERRRHTRVRLDGRAAARATIFAEFRVVSLSANGAAVEMELALALGSAWDLTLDLEQGEVDVKSVVASVERAAPGYRIGLDFAGVEDGAGPSGAAVTAGVKGTARAQVEARVLDLGLDGALLHLTTALEEGGIQDFVLNLDGDAVWVQAEVLRCRPTDRGGFHVGLSFLGIAPEHRRKLEQYIAKRQ